MDLRTWLASLPKFGTGAFTLFCVTAIASVLLADQPIAQLLLLTPRDVWSGGCVWQPLTANVLYPNAQVGLLFGTLVVQWFAGSPLERLWGTRKYVLLVVGCSVAGYLVSTLLGLISPAVAMTTVGGATGLDLAALVAFGVVFGDQRLATIPLTTRTLTILLVGLTLLSPLARGAPFAVVLPWLVTTGTAFLVTGWPFRRWRDSGKVRKSRSSRQRNHLRVVSRDHLN